MLPLHHLPLRLLTWKEVALQKEVTLRRASPMLGLPPLMCCLYLQVVPYSLARGLNRQQHSIGKSAPPPSPPPLSPHATARYLRQCVTCDVQVVLCSNHGGEPPQLYQRPPAPDSTKLEIAQQQGLAMGLPPVKAKGVFISLAHATVLCCIAPIS